jgi:hypothetical protein
VRLFDPDPFGPEALNVFQLFQCRLGDQHIGPGPRRDGPETQVIADGDPGDPIVDRIR